MVVHHHEEGEYCSGDIVYGISAEVVRDLHCGHYSFGTVIDYEFQETDISVMKKHYEEWSKQQAAIKAERERDIKEYSLCDEGGKTKYYKLSQECL